MISRKIIMSPRFWSVTGNWELFQSELKHTGLNCFKIYNWQFDILWKASEIIVRIRMRITSQHLLETRRAISLRHTYSPLLFRLRPNHPWNDITCTNPTKFCHFCIIVSAFIVWRKSQTWLRRQGLVHTGDKIDCTVDSVADTLSKSILSPVCTQPNLCDDVYEFRVTTACSTRLIVAKYCAADRRTWHVSSLFDEIWMSYKCISVGLIHNLHYVCSYSLACWLLRK